MTVVTKRVTDAPAADTTKRVVQSGGIAASSFDFWGGSWGNSWGNSWQVNVAAVAASLAVDATARVVGTAAEDTTKRVGVYTGDAAFSSAFSGAFDIEGTSETRRTTESPAGGITKRI